MLYGNVSQAYKALTACGSRPERDKIGTGDVRVPLQMRSKV